MRVVANSRERLAAAKIELQDLQVQLIGLYRHMTGEDIHRAPTIDELRQAASELMRQRDQAIDVGLKALQLRSAD